MRNKLKLPVICLSAVFVLSACATSKPALQGQINPTLGSAVKANIAQHAVAPTAAQKANTFIPADPARASLARQNYKENKVPEPERVKSNSN